MVQEPSSQKAMPSPVTRRASGAEPSGGEGGLEVRVVVAPARDSAAAHAEDVGDELVGGAGEDEVDGLVLVEDGRLRLILESTAGSAGARGLAINLCRPGAARSTACGA